MKKNMLIDATHAEETRVAVVDGQRLIDFDYESIVRKQLKGGIFLAKVTRVEPSLQAAFVNFGGNRHGFLPFSEIHPDYFRIPVADREALIAAQAAELEEHDEEEDDEEDAEGAELEDDEDDDDEDDAVEEVGGEDKPGNDEENIVAFEASEDAGDQESSAQPEDEDDQAQPQSAADGEEPEADGNQDSRRQQRGRGRNRRGGGGGRGRRSESRSKRVEVLGGDGADSDRPFRYNLRRQYKIQEVIKRGQIMLIQVSKEERGNKGAAVTTYLSLPGRYCVLMPNSPRGGGVSRKIASYQERKRMKDVLSDLSVPDGMSVILRTAGVSRTKAEIKRDLDYLTRLWNTIREDTLKSTAPALIYEEGSLIKRAIRDLYGRDIEEVYIAGEQGYKAARDFMKMLMPSHVKKVVEYKDDKVPLFHRYKVESQISEISKPVVTLKSGGYLVINPTEALVSVDVNSGRATRERHIEETALKTNMEAAEEVARQLRLRDLGGLVVIDFIDMEDRRNNRRVESKLKEALSSDRARIQVGRISSFGLMELSRQRLNPSLTEAQFEHCSQCQGVGWVRTQDFAAISFLRALEEEGIKARASEVTATLPDSVALYILNHKTRMLTEIEERYGFHVFIRTDSEMPRSEFLIEVAKKAAPESDDDDESEEDGDEAQNQNRNQNQSQSQTKSPDEEGEDKGARRGRRRGRRGGRRRNNKPQEGDESSSDDNDSDGNHASQDQEDQENAWDSEKKNAGRGRGRGRSGGRHKKDDDTNSESEPAEKKTKIIEDSSNDDGDMPPLKARSDNAASEQAQTAIVSAAPSNDVELVAVRNYETVNEQPEKKKKGWWNKLVE